LFDDDEQYRDWLEDNFGVRSSTDRRFTTRKASEAIGLMSRLEGNTSLPHPAKMDEELSSRREKKYRYRGTGKGGSAAGHLTQSQADEIGRLQDALGWNTARLTGFIRRQTKKFCTPEMLLSHEASRVISGMRAVLRDKKEVV